MPEIQNKLEAFDSRSYLDWRKHNINNSIIDIEKKLITGIDKNRRILNALNILILSLDTKNSDIRKEICKKGIKQHPRIQQVLVSKVEVDVNKSNV